jgi:hypothetical protein
MIKLKWSVGGNIVYAQLLVNFLAVVGTEV